MPTLNKTVVVQRPPQEVFDYLTQVSRHGEWSPKPWRLEGNPGPLASGTRFTSYGWIPGDKEHRNEVEVTECAPPSRITWETTEEQAPGRFVSTYVLTPEGSGTRVDRTFAFPDPTGGIRVIFPVIKGVIIRPTIVKGLNLFKERLESGSAASPAP